MTEAYYHQYVIFLTEQKTKNLNGRVWETLFKINKNASPDPYWGFAFGPHWGNSVPRPFDFVPPPNCFASQIPPCGWMWYSRYCTAGSILHCLHPCLCKSLPTVLRDKSLETLHVQVEVKNIPRSSLTNTVRPHNGDSSTFVSRLNV